MVSTAGIGDEARSRGDHVLTKVPLVIGSAGHRDLRDEDRATLERQVRAIFEGLGERYPVTPLVLLSPLAEGADRLVAGVALGCGARLVVPLPARQAEYERGFRDEASVAEFRALLGRATRAFVLEPPAVGTAPAREPERVGAYLARNCHILIALWDGNGSEEAGDAAAIVRDKREGVPHEFDPGQGPLGLPETGPVFQVVTPRRGRPVPPGALARRDGYPTTVADEAEARATFDRMCRLIDEFNRDVDALGAATQAGRARSRSYLLPPEEVAQLPESLSSCLDRYAMADTLAGFYQRRTHRALVAILVLGFLVTLLYQVHTRMRLVHPLSKPGRWYAGALFHRRLLDPVAAGSEIGLAPYDLAYLGAVAAVFAYFFLVQKRDDKRKHQDYRALAEGLRVQFYWRLAGLVDSAADHYLRKQKGELDWIRGAIRAGDLLEGVPTPADDPAVADHRIRLIREHWIEGQVAYFVGIANADGSGFRGKAQARRDERKAQRARRLGRVVIYYAGPALILARAFEAPPYLAVIALIQTTTVLFLVGIYARIMGFAEHARQYARMGIVYSVAGRRLGAILAGGPRDLGRARALLRDLGAEALAENGDWVLLHREKPLELPRL